MGMLENPEIFRDHFKEEEPFLLQDAKLGPAITTDYGSTRPVLLKIEDKWYTLFGQGITSQVERLEPGELPARVGVVRRKTRNGQEVKVIVPEGKLIADDEGTEEIPF